MNGDAIGPLSAAELGRRISSRDVSPTEAVNAYIERVDALDGQLGSFTLLGREEALGEAAERERELADGNSRGPLHGVPVAVKEQIDARGWPTTGGSAILRDAVPQSDATVTARLRDAGAIILGKLNMTELAIAETIEFPYGTPKNPWNPDRSPGSSSAGSGVATAAALCGATLGGDTGGSIRIPAAYCGVVGLRPTFGRVSRAGTLAACWSMDAIGPITRTVEDAALVLGAIAGPDPRDDWAADVPVPDYTDGLDAGVKGLRIGLITELMDSQLVDADVAAAVTESTRVLEGLGASVDEVALPMVAHAGPIHWTLCYVEFGQANRDTIRYRPQELTHMVRIAVTAGSLLPGVMYYKALQLRERLRNQVLEALTRFDVLVCPTMSSGAPPRAADVYTKSAEEVMEGLTGPVRLTAPFSHAGTPALSVPCGMTADGLPIGLQVIGKPFDEATVLRVGRAFEATTPWHEARPPIF